MEKQNTVIIVDLNKKEGVKIKIKCKKTKRFLCDIDYKSIIDVFEKYDISVEIPLKIVIPCRTCHESEVYNIYKDHYVFVENKKKK